MARMASQQDDEASTFVALEVTAAFLNRWEVTELHMIDGAVAAERVEVPLANQHQLQQRSGPQVTVLKYNYFWFPGGWGGGGV